jgi:thymidylate kinase
MNSINSSSQSNKFLPICLYGIDGVGKSTTINILASCFFEECEVEVRQWRPGWLPPLHILVNRQSQIIRVKDDLIIPRKEAGKLSFLRLLYYSIDFIIGAIYDKIKSSNKMIFFDRYYLDLFVNPERFGIKPTIWIKWFYYIVPKNNLNILLYGDTKQIHERKPELPLEVIQMHQQKWFGLFRKGYIDFAIMVNKNPSDIAFEIKDLILTKNNAVHKNRNVNIADQIVWFNSFFHIKSGLKDNLLLIHFPDGRGFILENKKTNKLARRLSIYSPGNWKARLYKRSIEITGKLRIMSFLLTKFECNKTQIEQFIAFVKNKINYHGEVLYSISLGAPGPRRKLVFCITDTNDNILAFAKLANNPEARKGLHNEYDTIKNLSQTGFKTLKIPEIHYMGEWESNVCLITSPIFKHFSGKKRFLLSDDELLELAIGFSKINFLSMPFAESTFYKHLAQMVESVQTPYFKHLCEDALALVLQLAGSTSLPFHLAHGDFTPWNMIVRDSQIGLFDFEYSLRSAPAGFDLIHYQLRKLSLVDRKSPNEIYKEYKNRTGWYNLLNHYLLKFNIDNDNLHDLTLVSIASYLIYSLIVFSKEQNICDSNIRLFNFLLTSILIDHFQKYQKHICENE